MPCQDLSDSLVRTCLHAHCAALHWNCPSQVPLTVYFLVPVPEYVDQKNVTLTREMLPEEAMVLLARKGKNIKAVGPTPHEALRAAMEQRAALVLQCGWRKKCAMREYRRRRVLAIVTKLCLLQER